MVPWNSKGKKDGSDFIRYRSETRVQLLQAVAGSM